jgi:YegS/Rv2252/BmrU family lipid kinase
MKKLLFVYNPRSGKGQIKNNVFDIINIFTAGGYTVTAYPTQALLDGYRMISENAKEYDIVVVSGGDGTLNEAVKALMSLPEKIPLGYIPSGSTNDFASSMSISKKMEEAAQDIVDGVFFEYDVGKFNDNYFVYVAAFGMFVDVSYETPQNMKNIFGHAAYVAEGLKRIPSYKGQEITVEHDGISETGNFLFGLVSNSTSIGGMKILVGDNVYFDDGLFEVTLVRTPTSPIALQQTLNDAIMNRLYTKNFLSFKSSKVTFRSAEPVTWTLDGEAGGQHTQAVVENCCRAIKLVIKPGEKTEQQQEIDMLEGEKDYNNDKNLRAMLFEDQKNIEN